LQAARGEKLTPEKVDELRKIAVELPNNPYKLDQARTGRSPSGFAASFSTSELQELIDKRDWFKVLRGPEPRRGLLRHVPFIGIRWKWWGGGQSSRKNEGRGLSG